MFFRFNGAAHFNYRARTTCNHTTYVFVKYKHISTLMTSHRQLATTKWISTIFKLLRR